MILLFADDCNDINLIFILFVVYQYAHLASLHVDFISTYCCGYINGRGTINNTIGSAFCCSAVLPTVVLYMFCTCAAHAVHVMLTM